MLCEKCGAKIEEGRKYCSVCGAKVKDNDNLIMMGENDTSGDDTKKSNNLFWTIFWIVIAIIIIVCIIISL